MDKGKKQLDWESIEGEYRANSLSICEIARRYGCSDAAIHKRAKRDGWERNLSKKVASKIREKLVREESKPEPVRSDKVNDEQIVEAAAQRGVDVIKVHRGDIRRLRDLEEKLMIELGDDPKKLYLAQYQGKVVKKIVGIPVTERSMALNNLANVQHKRIALERQAYNLNESPDKPDDGMTIDEKLVRIQELLEKAKRIH